jgi:hypothetical protein
MGRHESPKAPCRTARQAHLSIPRYGEARGQCRGQGSGKRVVDRKSCTRRRRTVVLHHDAAAPEALEALSIDGAQRLKVATSQASQMQGYHKPQLPPRAYGDISQAHNNKSCEE